jgi:hypothetical protein
MSRYILRYGGSQSAPSEHLESIRATPGLRVLDQSPKMLLVDADESSLRAQLKAMPGWSMHPEQSYPLPDTRKKIE